MTDDERAAHIAYIRAMCDEIRAHWARLDADALPPDPPEPNDRPALRLIRGGLSPRHPKPGRHIPQ